MEPNRPIPEQARVCRACSKREAVCTPVVYVPILRWPKPLYMQAKFGLCAPCAQAFTLNKWTDYDGSWYDLAADSIRSHRVPAQNPFPEDPSFKWEDFLLDPKFDPAPKEECYVKFWRIETINMKAYRERIDSHLGRPR